MINRKVAEKRVASSHATTHLPIVHRLHTLLHTMRAIDQHEEQLCSLLHHIETAGRLDPTVTHELRILLEDLPALSYQSDLDALRKALPVVAKPPTGHRR